MDRLSLAAQLEIEEGKKARMYLDTEGCWTAGVGRNLSERPFSEDEIQLMLKNDIAIAEAALDRNCPWWRSMTEARQQALAGMCFQLGISRLLGFKKMLVMLEAGRWDAAAAEALDSKWAKQVPARAKRVTDLIRKGEF
jgi:lysozyme